MSEVRRASDNWTPQSLDTDDRAWLEERLQEYRELLSYLREH